MHVRDDTRYDDRLGGRSLTSQLLDNVYNNQVVTWPRRDKQKSRHLSYRPSKSDVTAS